MINLNFKPFPILETERLLLREVTLEDVDSIFEYRSNPRVMKYIGKPTAKYREEIIDLLEWINDGKLNMTWGISLKNNPKLIGMIGYYRTQPQHFRSELGYMLGQEFWNQNIMSEAIPAIINLGFEKMELHSIEARIDPENGASRKVLLKNNFVKEGYFKHDHFFEGKFLDSEIYSLLKPTQVPTK